MNTEQKKTRKRRIEGMVVSISGAQSVVVETMRVYRHPVYGKKLKQTTKYMAHNPNDAAKVGDSVVIQECRPFSRRKRWIIIKEV